MKKEEFEKGLRVQEMDKPTDDEGKVVFKDLPVGQYLIEVEGAGEF